MTNDLDQLKAAARANVQVHVDQALAMLAAGVPTDQVFVRVNIALEAMNINPAKMTALFATAVLMIADPSIDLSEMDG